MNTNLIRLAAGFTVCVGLAYISHQVFMQPLPGEQVAAAASGAPPAAAAAPAPGTRAYVIYPDGATEKEFKLDYATFQGSFVDEVTVIPLPPHFSGAATLRVVAGDAHAVEIGLNETRCASAVRVAFHRLTDKTPVASGALDATTPKLTIPFVDGKMPAGLLDMRMDEKAENNYWCGVTVRWLK